MPSSTSTSKRSRTSLNKAHSTTTSDGNPVGQNDNGNAASHSGDNVKGVEPTASNTNHENFEIMVTDTQQHPEVLMKTPKNHSLEEYRFIEKHLGPIGGFSLITGVIIGSGIFISVKGSLAVFPPATGALVLLWVFGGLISLFGGLSYVQLGIMVPMSGGERTYLFEAFGPQFAIVFTYGYCFIVKTLALAGIAQTFGKYFFEMVFGNYRDPAHLDSVFAAIAILILVLINSFSKDLANRTQIVFTVLKLLAIGGIIIIGIVYISIGKGFKDPNPFKKPFVAEEIHFKYLPNCLINIFWAYEGWNSLGAMVGEMKNPKRDLPISITLGIIVVVIVYCLTIIAYVGVLGYDTVMTTETVAAVFASNTIPKASWIIPLFICISTFGACNGTILGISRIVMTAAVNKEVPGVFGLVYGKQRTPAIAIVSTSAISMFFLILPFQQLITYCAVISWIFYGLTMCAVIKLYWTRTDLDRSFKLPTVFPIIVLLVAIYIVVMGFVDYPTASCIIVGALLVVFGIHFLPDRILKPRAMKKAHSACKHVLVKYMGLTMADQQDIS